MEIQIAQSKLNKALSIVSRVAAGSRTTLPILNNVLIKVEGEKVSLTSTNLDMAVVDYLPVKGLDDGELTVPARLLADFVGNLPRENIVTIKGSGNKLEVKAGKYSSLINGASAKDFPELPDMDVEKVVKVSLPVDEFKNGINQVIIASSNDMTRPALTGVYFNTDNGILYVAATDGYRLAEKKISDKCEMEVKAIVPTVSLQEVMRSISDNIDTIEILFGDSQVKFRMGEVEITSKLIDGSFPDYRKLIPQENEIEMTFDKEEFLRIAKLAALFAKEVGGSIICEALKEKGGLSVKSVANEYGENDSVMDAEVVNEGKVTLNSRFLIDALNAVEEKRVKFVFSAKMSPVIVRNEVSRGYTHIIMPLNS